MFQALSHPVRRHILKLLADGPLSAGEIAAHFELTKPTLSSHFNVLRGADLVQSERHGTSIRYRLNVSVVEEAAAAILDMVGKGAARPSPIKLVAKRRISE